jgi:hypothetical protein
MPDTTQRYDAVEAITERRQPRDFYDPEVYRTAYVQADTEGRERLRRHLGRIDSGRFNDFLDETHRLISRSDRRRRRHAAETFSEWTLSWVATWALIQDLDPLPNVTGVSVPSRD